MVAAVLGDDDDDDGDKPSGIRRARKSLEDGAAAGTPRSGVDVKCVPLLCTLSYVSHHVVTAARLC